MAQYKLHCFCQSGNSYKVALYLNCAGLDWEPVFVDFFKGATRDPNGARASTRWARRRCWRRRPRSSLSRARSCSYLAEMTDKFAPQDDDERIEALRWILFDNHKFTSYFATYRFLKSFLPAGAGPQRTGVSQGPLRRRGRHRRQASGQVEVHGRRQADHRRLLARRLRLLSGRGARLRLGQARHPNIHAWTERMRALPGLEGPLRADARRAHQAAAGKCAGSGRRADRSHAAQGIVCQHSRELAGAHLAPRLAACPLHSAEKSPRPAASAFAFSGARAPPAVGNAGARSDIGPTSRIARLRIPRAGLPVKIFVSAV